MSSTSSTPPAPTGAHSGWPAARPSTTATSPTGSAPPAVSTAEIDGITGASVGAGRTLTITLDLADTLIDGGFEVRVDTAVEDMRDNPSDVAAPLTAAGNGKPVAGRGYVERFTYSF